MLWRNKTNISQLVYDDTWNPHYVKPGGTINDSAVPTEKLLNFFTPIKTKPVIGVLSNRYKNTHVIKLLKQHSPFEIFEIPLLHETIPETTLRNKYLNVLFPDIIITLEDGERYKSIIKLCQLLKIKVIFLVSEIMQHKTTDAVYSDMVVTYGDFSKEQFEKITNKPVKTANYLQYGLKKLTKAQRDKNNLVLVRDGNELSQSTIRGIKDIYSLKQQFDIPFFFNYRFSSPQIAHIHNSNVNLDIASVVIAPPSFALISAAILGIPTIKLEYSIIGFPDLHFNIRERTDIIPIIRKTLNATKEDMKKQTTALHNICVTNKSDTLTEMITEMIND